VIELVDFNTGQEPAEKTAPERRRRNPRRPQRGSRRRRPPVRRRPTQAARRRRHPLRRSPRRSPAERDSFRFFLMKILTADFVLGVADIRQLPKDGLKEIAFLGRSNVGKSSLINKLCGRKSLARPAPSPAKPGSSITMPSTNSGTSSTFPLRVRTPSRTDPFELGETHRAIPQEPQGTGARHPAHRRPA